MKYKIKFLSDKRLQEIIVTKPKTLGEQCRTIATRDEQFLMALELQMFRVNQSNRQTQRRTYMKKKEYVVRVVQTHTPEGQELYEGDNVGSFVECLRYAGLVTIHPTDTLTSLCFDIHCPHGLESKPWSEMNAKRMQSFGYNAVSAPAC